MSFVLHFLVPMQYSTCVLFSSSQGFNKALGQIVGHGVANSTRSFARALTRSRSRGSDPAAYYASQLDRLTAAFAYCSDIALTMGGKIKVCMYCVSCAVAESGMASWW